MKYLLFISFNSGLMHNNIYRTLKDVCESIIQLVQDEELDLKNETMPCVHKIKQYLNKNDDYFGQLSNGTWYHIQPQSLAG